MRIRPSAPLLLFLAFLLAGALLPTAQGRASQEPNFPEYDCLKNNVRFWETVFTRYSNNTGLLHDEDDLSIIYEVIDLTPISRESVADKRKSQLITETSEKYRQILLRLANGQKPETQAEKQVAAMFGGNPSPERLMQASESIRLQICQGESFLSGLIRSGRYLDRMKAIFEEAGLPSDLAYLPHVESAFNYEAYSKVGAAGIWQFTEETGKRYLTIDPAVDERRDPIRATQAAARYLKKNHELLGSWPLAITAYNHGESGILRAKQELESFPRIFHEYTGKRFGFASRNFYAEFLAARKVAKNYLNYYGEVEKERPLFTREVQLTGFVSTSDLTKYFQLDQDLLKQLNPSLRPPVLSGEKHIPKGYSLRLPVEAGNYLVAGSRLPESLYQSDQKRSIFYTVRRGDTVNSISRAHKITVKELIAANNLGSKATIVVGQSLRIPKPAPGKQEMATLRDQVRSAQNTNGAVNAQQPKPQPAPAARKTTSSEVDHAGAAIIAAAATPGEEPAEFQIEDRISAQLSSLAISSSYTETEGIKPGKTKTAARKEQPKDNAVSPAQAKAMVATEDLAVRKTFTKKGQKFGVIKVAHGETMSHYAEWLQTPAKDLHKLNGQQMGKALKPAQEITLPFTRVAKTAFEELRHEHHRTVEEDFFSSFRIKTIASYRVQKGDTLWSLCNEKLDVPVWLLKRYNETLDLERLQPDQKLVVPLLVQQS